MLGRKDNGKPVPEKFDLTKIPKSKNDIRGPLKKPQEIALSGSLPTTVDWVAEGATTPVKVQIVINKFYTNIAYNVTLICIESRSVRILLGALCSRGGGVSVDHERQHRVGVLCAAGHQLHGLHPRLRRWRHCLRYGIVARSTVT